MRQIGLRIIVSLQLGAADLLQEGGLRLRFHALAYGVDPQRGRHSHHLGQNDLPAVPLIQPPRKAHVEFDEVKFDALQDVQGRIAASEIVHPHLEAMGTEMLDLLLHVVEVAAHHALGDLHMDELAVHAGLVHHAAELLHQIAGVKIHAGEVDGNRQTPDAAFLGGLQIPENLSHDAQIQLVDQAGLLQDRDKGSR